MEKESSTQVEGPSDLHHVTVIEFDFNAAQIEFVSERQHALMTITVRTFKGLTSIGAAVD